MTLPIYLGTANFGAPYGLTSKRRIPKDEIEKMLNWSRQHAYHLDLSIDYEGASETIGTSGSGFEVSTKLKFSHFSNVVDLENTLKIELTKLQLERAHIVLIRSESQYTKMDKHKWKDLLELKSSGLIQNLGFSVYSPTDMLEATEIFSPIDYFQVPSSVADQRFDLFLSKESKFLHHCRFLVRSIFLQGLLTMDENKIPNQLAQIIPWRRRLLSKTKSKDANLFQLSVDYIRSLGWVSGVVVGANDLTQLTQIHEGFSNNSFFVKQWMNELELLPDNILDPRQWTSV